MKLIIVIFLSFGLFSCASESKRDKAVKAYKKKLQKQRVEANRGSSEYINVPQ